MRHFYSSISFLTLCKKVLRNGDIDLKNTGYNIGGILSGTANTILEADKGEFCPNLDFPGPGDLDVYFQEYKYTFIIRTYVIKILATKSRVNGCTMLREHRKKRRIRVIFGHLGERLLKILISLGISEYLFITNINHFDFQDLDMQKVFITPYGAQDAKKDVF